MILHAQQSLVELGVEPITQLCLLLLLHLFGDV
jgi:hypothetical protein